MNSPKPFQQFLKKVGGQSGHTNSQVTMVKLQNNGAQELKNFRKNAISKEG